MPTKAIHGITVAHFYETYREKLQLELAAGGAGLHRLIREGSINRPSLALTGFFKYFANKRIQVFGAAGVSQDTFLAKAYTYARFMRIGDGPDQVHLSAIGKQLLRQYGVPRKPAASH